MSIEKVLYRAAASATGGRDGRASTSDGQVDLRLTTARELGGAGGTGTNPEQLFALAYSACFLGAIRFVAARDKLPMPADASVRARSASAPSRAALASKLTSRSACPGCCEASRRPWSNVPTSSARTPTPHATT